MFFFFYLQVVTSCVPQLVQDLVSYIFFISLENVAVTNKQLQCNTFTTIYKCATLFYFCHSVTHAQLQSHTGIHSVMHITNTFYQSETLSTYSTTLQLTFN